MSEKESEGGFSVQDRRHFDKNGNVVSSEEGSAAETKTPPSEARDTASEVPEKIDLTSLLFSYVHTALIHLGDVEDPLEKKREMNLPAARQMIDILELLQEKTKGNLTSEEGAFLERSLFDLRMRFLQKSGIVK